MDPREAARDAYEAGRRMLGLQTAACVSMIVAPFYVWDGWGTLRGAATAMLLALAGAAAWYGRSPARGLLSGAAAGLIPAVLTLAVQGMACSSGACSSWCMAACVTGGGLAGLLVGTLSLRSSEAALERATASAVAILIGAHGCACLGAGGILGMAIALLAVVPIPLRARAHI